MESEVAIIILGLDPGANPLCALVGDFGANPLCALVGVFGSTAALCDRGMGRQGCARARFEDVQTAPRETKGKRIRRKLNTRRKTRGWQVSDSKNILYLIGKTPRGKYPQAIPRHIIRESETEPPA